ncbi:hypothetical protein ZWY2020_034250 [Hordeum vulgare]|nr:hypothetical protein ZWY2020_034250 [Hordeum vulgare]
MEARRVTRQASSKRGSHDHGRKGEQQLCRGPRLESGARRQRPVVERSGGAHLPIMAWAVSRQTARAGSRLGEILWWPRRAEAEAESCLFLWWMTGARRLEAQQRWAARRRGCGGELGTCQGTVELDGAM